MRRVSNRGRHPSRSRARKSDKSDLRINLPISAEPEIGARLLRMRTENDLIQRREEPHSSLYPYACTLPVAP